MLHEILLALIGHTGSIIVENEDQSFTVSNKIDFLTEAEREQINRIIILGVFYKRINDFIKAKGGLNSRLALQLQFDDMKLINDQFEITGVYVKAFCAGA